MIKKFVKIVYNQENIVFIVQKIVKKNWKKVVDFQIIIEEIEEVDQKNN